jgi:hypothetical protein
MFENELTIYIDFYPDKTHKGYIAIVNPDGTTLLKQEEEKHYPSSWLIIPGDGFNTKFLSDNGDPEFKHWEKELPMLIGYFKKMKKDLAQELCFENRGSSFFKLYLFQETKGKSSQDDELIDKHNGWYYLEFDENFSELYRVPKFKEIAEAKFIYNSTDRDCPEIKMFFKDLLSQNMNNCFQYVIGLRKALAELSDFWEELLEQYSSSNPWEYLDEHPTT